jgi:hypothetical protein
MFSFEYRLCRATKFPSINWNGRKQKYGGSVSKTIQEDGQIPGDFGYYSQAIALGQDGYNNLTQLAAAGGGTPASVDRMMKLHTALIRLKDAQIAGNQGFLTTLPDLKM